MFPPKKAPSYMQELDAWAEENVIGPLVDPRSADPGEDREAIIARVKKAIRESTLTNARAKVVFGGMNYEDGGILHPSLTSKVFSSSVYSVHYQPIEQNVGRLGDFCSTTERSNRNNDSLTERVEA